MSRIADVANRALHRTQLAGTDLTVSTEGALDHANV